jgi:hypothetical protein
MPWLSEAPYGVDISPQIRRWQENESDGIVTYLIGHRAVSEQTLRHTLTIHTEVHRLDSRMSAAN